VWYHVFEIMATVAIITNALLICFTENHFTQLPAIRRFSRLGILITIEHVAYFCKTGLAVMMPTVPPQVALQQRRAAHFVSTLWRLEEEQDVLHDEDADHVENRVEDTDDGGESSTRLDERRGTQMLTEKNHQEQLGAYADDVQDEDADVWHPAEEEEFVATQAARKTSKRSTKSRYYAALHRTHAPILAYTALDPGTIRDTILYAHTHTRIHCTRQQGGRWQV
jgi:hypothetical protein